MTSPQLRPKVKAFLLVGLLALASAAFGPPADLEATGSRSGQAALALLCPLPISHALFGVTAKLDQCYQRPINYAGTTYTFRIYYTETPGAHDLPNQDDANGDNVFAVALAAEVEQAFLWNKIRLLEVLDPGQTVLTVYVRDAQAAEGRTLTHNNIILSNALVDGPDTLRLRSAVQHEIHHLAQFQFTDMIGKKYSFTGEGIAYAIEDRVDPQADADLWSRFRMIVEQDVIASDANRTADLATLTTPSLLWWTWLMDQNTLPYETDLSKGWGRLREFYVDLAAANNELAALAYFLTSNSNSFAEDFVDYTLAMYAFPYHPADPRLDFLDQELHQTLPNGLIGHTTLHGTGTDLPYMNPRSVRYWEFSPAAQCEFLRFVFSGLGQPYAFSVMTVDDGNLQSRWTTYGTNWARALYSGNLERVVGVVTSTQSTGLVSVNRGCVKATLNIQYPTGMSAAYVGSAANPKNFGVRVNALAGGQPLVGLLASDFSVRLRDPSNGAEIQATVLNGAYMQDDYWLMVRAPDAGDGVVTGQAYDLLVNLGSVGDAESGAVVYDLLTTDWVMVLDASGTIVLPPEKYNAERNAADLLINELDTADQGGLVVFGEAGSVGGELRPLGSGIGSHREALLAYLARVRPDGGTSIGDGLRVAADLHAAGGAPGRPCTFILISDGHENATPYWGDVQASVIDNGCAIHTIALGPQSDELLLQEIARSPSGGSFDFAISSGSVRLPTGVIGWDNYLTQVLDYKASLISGRQVLARYAGVPSGEAQYSIPVEAGDSRLRVVLAWQDPNAGPQLVELLDPGGSPAVDAVQRVSPQNTNQVWEVASPQPGTWTLVVEDLNQEHYVGAAAVSDIQLHLFLGGPTRSQGAAVPILASFVDRNAPIEGASAVATVIDPSGGVRTLTLYDDGNHGDSLPGDGVYGNVYTTTIEAEQVAGSPVPEGSEPTVIGSYSVTVVARRGDIQREAQGSFAVAPGPDEDGDEMPDGWEDEHGVDDPSGDLDGDGLTNLCEYLGGTEPRNGDTDGGGESDGSENPGCGPTAVQDPLDPEDDRVGELAGVVVLAESDGEPFVRVQWGQPLEGRLVAVDVFRRSGESDGTPTSQWEPVSSGFEGIFLDDRAVSDGQTVQYRVVPHVAVASRTDDGAILMSGPLDSAWVTARSDPYPPGGSVWIDEGTGTTPGTLVQLTILAGDTLGPEDFGTGEPIPGSSADDLDMQVSSRADFDGVEWTAYTPEMLWDLGDLGVGDTVGVYVRFRDQAGNIGLGLPAFITYQPFCALPELVDHLARVWEAGRIQQRGKFESLHALLVNAQRSMDEGRTQPALESLTSFLDAVERQLAQGSLAAPDASSLASGARCVLDHLEA